MPTPQDLRAAMEFIAERDAMAAAIEVGQSLDLAQAILELAYRVDKIEKGDN